MLYGENKVSKYHRRIIFIFVASLLFIGVGYLAYQKITYPKDIASGAFSATVLDSKLSVKLQIPSLNINANVISVGINSIGEMDVPKSPDDVAWFKFGPIPGEVGSAVIDGHSGWKDNIPAVFDDLYKLKKGDKIYITNKKRETVAFIVREKQLYNPGIDATNVFTSNDGKAHLNLITCEGIWDEITKSRSQRLVVFTDKEDL